MADSVNIQVRFSKTTPAGLEYHDALYFSQEQFDKHTPDEIEVMKQDRFDNWVSTLNAVEPVPTKEDLQNQEASLIQQKESIQRQIDEVAVKISEKG